jgi:cell division protein FtsQ
MWHQLIEMRGIEVNKTFIKDIKCGEIETEALQNPWVENPQVYIDNNEVMHIFVSQRKPVARVFFDNGQSFYLDPTLKLLPLSNMFTYYTTIVTNVPVYNNDSMDNDMRGRILKLVKFIDRDTFWNAQIAQVIVTTKGDFTLIPVLGNQTIIFGDTTRMVEKFSDLFAFYKKVLNRIGWDKYTELDVRYKNQIVASPAIPFKLSSKNALSNMDWVKSILDAQPKTDTGSTTMKQDAAKEQVVATVLEKKVSDEQLKQQIIQPRNNRAQKVFAGDHNKTLNKEHGRH